MHTAARKLHSRRGASLMFALLVFFLCLLAGVAALTAAAANAGRYTHLEEDQRQYFSVASALELLQSDLDDLTTASPSPLTVTVDYIKEETWYYDETNNKWQTTDPVYTLAGSSPTNLNTLNYFQYLLLKKNLPEAWQDKLLILPTATTTWSDKTFDITLTNPPPELEGAIRPVSVKVHNDKDNESYSLEMKLTADGDAYPLTVVWPGDVKVTTTVNTEVTGNVPPASSFTPTPPANPDSTGTRTTTTTLTCTLCWSKDNRTVTFG